jgi:TonB family protein
MDSKRTRRFLIVAFALSLLLHLILSGVIHWPLNPSNQAEQIVHVARLNVTHVVRTPRPLPTPPPVVHRAAVRVAKATAVNPHGHTGEGRAVYATPAPTEPPATPSPAPACSGTDTPVQLIASPAPPDIAPAARSDRISGIAQIHVTVSPEGAVENANVASSSGSTSLDLVALTMAKSAEYSPATHACKAIASDYTFSVRFIAY